MIAELRKQLETEAAEEEDNVQASIKLSLLFPKIFQKTKQEEEKTAMYGKVVLSFIFVLLLVFSYSIFIGTLDIRSYFFPRLKLPAAAPAPCAPEPPLRVFMYDLPRRFNVGMIDRRSAAEMPVTVEEWPAWPVNWGLKKQHSVEYWMMGSLLNVGGGREVVRVSDPELAQAFFVPFFSSLSFNTHGHTMKDPATQIDRQLQVRRYVSQLFRIDL